MNKTQKIWLGVLVGGAVAYWMHKRNKSVPAKSVLKTKEDINGAVADVMDSKLETREEQIAYILENTEANLKEETSGFEGVHFVWNEKLGAFYPQGTLTETKEPAYAQSVFLGADGSNNNGVRFVWNKKLGKYYPTGTIVEGQEPAYADSVFYGADGETTNDPTDKAEEILSQLSDQEIKLAYNLVKYRKENPSNISEEQAFKEIGGNDPKIIEVIKVKITPRLNDIKALRKDKSWKASWQKKKEKFQTLLNKAMRCGRKPMNKRKLEAWKSCLASVNTNDANKHERDIEKFAKKECSNKRFRNRADYQQCLNNAKKKFNQALVQTAPLEVKDEFNQVRQEEFASQVTNRRDGALFGGRRWDGRSNKVEEELVKAGI